MVPNPNKGPIYKLFWLIGHSPRKILEVLQFGLLGWVLAQTLFGFGGFLPYGEPLIGVSKSLMLLAAVHALVLAFRHERPGLEWEMILPLPFLLYALAHTAFISPARGEAAATLAVLVQAYVIFSVVFNSIRGVKPARWSLYITQMVMGIALGAAVFEFYLFPKWMPVAERVRNPDYALGAAGFLQDPANLAALLLPFLPLCFMLAAKYYRTSPVWILQAFLAFFIVIGLLISSNLWGLLVLALVLVLLPFIMTGFWNSRWRVWRNFLLAIPVLGFVMWYGTDELQQRLTWYLSLPADPLGAASRAVALAQFTAAPFAGQGLGAFAGLWEGFAPAGVGGTAVYPLSLYAGLLAETGVIGLLLAGVPVLLLLARGFRIWRALPYLRLHPDVLNRLSDLSANHPLRRRAERHGGRMSSQKAILGGLLLGLLALLLYAACDYAFQLPITLFLFASLAGCFAAYCRGLERTPANRLGWLPAALIPFVLSAWAASFGAPRFLASHIVYTANEDLAYLLEDPDRIFADPGTLSVVEENFRIITELDPANGAAWAGLANARLAELHAGLLGGAEIAGKAVPPLEQALAADPGAWLAHYNLARALALLDRPAGEIESRLRTAHELAPNRPEPLAFLGGLAFLSGSDLQGGTDLLERALQLDPGYAPARNALERLGSQPASGGTGRRSSVITSAYLAEQFVLRPGQPERVRGAGLPR